MGRSSVFSLDFKGTLSRLRHFFATESPLKSMKNASYFTLTALFVLFKFFVSILLSSRKTT